MTKPSKDPKIEVAVWYIAERLSFQDIDYRNPAAEMITPKRESQGNNQSQTQLSP